MNTYLYTQLQAFVFLLAVVMSPCCVHAQTSLPQHEWHVTLKVVDEAGQPVPGAKAGVGFYYTTPPPESKYTAAGIHGLTDTNGVFTASHASAFCTLSFRVEKAGYYTTGSRYSAGADYDPMKWNPSLTLVLKKIGQPIPMYAKWFHSDPPATNQLVGYDLMVGDWVDPYGKGKVTDIFFEKTYTKKRYDDFEYKIAVSFPNPGDGIQEFSMDTVGSDLHSPRQAPTAGYQTKLIRETIRHPGQPGKSDYNENRNYLFRVRTLLDENGNVKSALYGKIYGDFMQFTYYLNPTPNDRNMEFDPKHNLLNEKVNAP